MHYSKFGDIVVTSHFESSVFSVCDNDSIPTSNLGRIAVSQPSYSTTDLLQHAIACPGLCHSLPRSMA